jgi:uncharacterized membrane protein (DUF106 family)
MNLFNWQDRLGVWYADKLEALENGIGNIFANGADMMWQILIIAAIVGVYMNIAGYKKYGNNTIKISILIALVASVAGLYV